MGNSHTLWAIHYTGTMADNYLGNKFEEFERKYGLKHRGSSTLKNRPGPSLDTLLKQNRSTRGYDPSFPVGEEVLRDIIRVNTLIASAGNAQRLRFRPVCEDSQVRLVHPLLKMGAALPELHLPLPGTDPPAYIVVCTTASVEDRMVAIDLGISFQSMALRAVEKGLRCLMIESFDRDGLVEALSLPYPPVGVLAVGKGAESIYLMPTDGGDLRYYRREGVHFVPKLSLESILI